MKKMTLIFVSALVIIWAMGYADVRAEEPPVKVMESGGIGYMTGGVGMHERAAMKEMAQDFNLKLVFAKANGSYVAQVPFWISNTNGESLLKDVANGPWVLADVPPGTYEVGAMYNGEEKVQTIEAGSELKTCTFLW